MLMKKLFTMLGAALMMGCFAANAGVAITANYCYYEGGDYIDAEPFETELVKNVDGSLTIKNFMNSGYPASFKFDEVEAGGYATLSMCDNILALSGYEPYLMKSNDFKVDEEGWPESDDDYMVCYYYNSEGGDATAIDYPYIYQSDINYTYVYRYDDSSEYYVCMYLCGNFEDGSDSWGCVTFYFDMPPVETPLSVMVYDYDGNKVAQNFETGLVKNDDGSYTMTDFFNSGYPISFKFDVPANEGDKSTITFTGNVSVDGNYVYFLDSEGADFECVMYPEGSRKGTTLYYPGAYAGAGYCYVKKLSEEYAESYGYEYMGAITMYCIPGETDESDEYVYYYLYFYFNLPETAGSTDNNTGTEESGTEESGTEESGTGEPVSSVETEFYVMDYGYYNEMADPTVSNLIAYDNGTYTIENFLNSGQPVSFKFTPAEADEYSYNFEITSPLDSSSYFLSPDGEEWLNGAIYGYNGSTDATTLYYLCTYPSYNCVYTYPEGSAHDYWVYLCMNAYADQDGNTTFGWFWVGFDIDAPETDAVKAIENEDAPVEYYNLNGVRVANPSNGIFIRKQGNTVKKVVIK